MHNNIGEFIKHMRKYRKITQKQLGDILGIDAKAISKWESGVYLPDITMLTSISNALNITVDELLNCKLNEVKEEIIISKDNNLEEQKNKPSNNKKIIVFITIFIVFILALASISIKVSFSKKNESTPITETNVYKINSDDDNLIIEGYIIQKGISYLTIINRLNIKTKEFGITELNYNDKISINICSSENCIFLYSSTGLINNQNIEEYYEFVSTSSQTIERELVDYENPILIINKTENSKSKNIAQFSLEITPYFS